MKRKGLKVKTLIKSGGITPQHSRRVLVVKR